MSYVYSGFTRPCNVTFPVCGCGTVTIVYFVRDLRVHQSVVLCPRCEATWTGSELHRLHVWQGEQARKRDAFMEFADSVGGFPTGMLATAKP